MTIKGGMRIVNAILPGIIIGGFIVGILSIIGSFAVFIVYRINELSICRIKLSNFRFVGIGIDSFFCKQGRFRSFIEAIGIVFGAVSITSFSLLHDLSFSAFVVIFGFTWVGVLLILTRFTFAWKKAGYSVVLFWAAIVFAGFLTFQLAPVFPGILGLICFVFWCIDGIRGKSEMTYIFNRHSFLKEIEESIENDHPDRPPREDPKLIKIFSVVIVILFIALVAWQIYRVISIWIG